MKAQPTGEHEIHVEGCYRLPDLKNRKSLGYFSNCKDALKKAKEYYENVDGCYYCCPDCHKK
jgi:hypothetical protein